MIDLKELGIGVGEFAAKNISANRVIVPVQDGRSTQRSYSVIPYVTFQPEKPATDRAKESKTIGHQVRADEREGRSSWVN
uniref:Hva1_TUDOR domain-containing protein n=1 Tax=Heterorhabditis bacteriophora TaxID=37862 RepID=A0A1I7XJ99_HETBA